MVGRVDKRFLRVRPFLVAFFFAFSVIAGALQGGLSVQAAGGTATWTGAGGDNKFSNVDNWLEEAIPENGDLLVLSHVPPNPGDPEDYYSVDLDNDVEVSYSGVSITPNEEEGSVYFDGYNLLNDLNLQNGAIWNTAGKSLNIDTTSGARINVAGDLTVLSKIDIDAINVTGALIIDNSYGNNVLNGYVSAASVVVRDGSSIYFHQCDDVPTLTISTPLTLGGGDTDKAAPMVASTCWAGSSTPKAKKLVINNVTLLSNAQVSVYSPNSTEIKNITKNGFDITRSEVSTGVLKVGSDVQENEAKNTTVNDKKPNDELVVVDNETTTLNGTRGYVNVGHGGTLKGTGTASSLSVHTGGTVAPGLSPGNLTVLENLFLSTGSTFEAEILNKDKYDQLSVGKDAEEDYPAVYLDNSTLKIVLYEGYNIKKGDKFTIIDNLSDSDVEGTFQGLAEGAQVKVGNITFSITYKGGDGNDTVLTALNTGNDPKAPNTGAAKLVTANPVVIATLGVITAIGLLVVAKRRTNN